MSKTEISLELQQAIAAARAGKLAQAQAMANKVVETEPDNAHAWFLLSTLADSEEEQVQYLDRVLEIDPEHRVATERLAQITAAAPGEPAEPEPEAIVASEELPAETVVVEELAQEFDEIPGPEPDEEPEEFPEEQLATVVAAAAISDESLGVIDQADSDTVPAWLADEGGFQQKEDVEELEEVADGTVQPEFQEIPDWLQEEPADAWLQESLAQELEPATPKREPVSASAEIPEAEAPTAEGAAKKAEKRRTSTRTYEIVLVILIIMALAVVGALAYVIISPPF